MASIDQLPEEDGPSPMRGPLPGLDNPPSEGDYTSTADWLTRPYPNGDILFNVLRDLDMVDAESIENGDTSSFHATTQLNPFQTIWNHITRRSAEEPPKQILPIQTNPVHPAVPIPYEEIVTHFQTEPYMERALRLCPSAKTWHYTQEDADMAQRVRSGNAQSNTNSPSLSQEDSGSATDSPRLTPEELWLRGPPK